MSAGIARAEAAAIVLRCLDLTSLNADDCAADIDALCQRAQTPYGAVAAVCVWPRFVAQARARLERTIGVAAVANFPHGTQDTATTLAEVQCIAHNGANEVDVVLPYRALQQGRVRECADFLAAVRAACGGLTLKVIIESGVLAEAALIAQATDLALAQGADFVKTSTGKSAVSATPEAASTMLARIAVCGRAAGFKASGGIRTLAQEQPYLSLVQQHLGAQALAPQRLRFGASALLGDIQAVLGGAARPPSSHAY
ncbi:MAG: deoxyribose-phosphate aldolase [Rhodoferax sp.]